MSSAADREKQIAQAEEMLGDRLAKVGFAKGLYFGQFQSDKLLAFPDLEADEATNQKVEQLRQFCREHVDPVAIDRDAEIPQSVVEGLGKLGVLGACLPTEAGGRGMTQTQYCRLLEVLGGCCASTALFVNAHHSIGPRALVLFGTPEQQKKWLPKMATGEWISAFALTEPEAGSDAANVQTRAEPSPDGRGYILNGEKRWITNGGLAQALIVMARTPVEGSDDTKITAFQVTSDMPGFEVVEARMPKMGVRGTATSRLKFTDMFVPKENILGPLGKGLRVALTVLDFGRTTFGATCTGAAKFCCERSRARVKERVQFGQPIANFELVKQKIARMRAGAYAMEACTYQTAQLIDSGEDDYMLETAILKVFNTETLWQILDDTFQLHGGLAYFKDQPFERMIRDARINSIGEGSNDVLRPFIALVGMRDVGLQLQGILQSLSHPLRNLGRLGGFAGQRVGRMFGSPEVRVRNGELSDDAARLGKLVGKFGGHVERLLRTYREAVLDRQYQLARVANAAMHLYVGSCVLSRLDAALDNARLSEERKRQELRAGRHFLLLAKRVVEQNLAAAWDNDDDATTAFADFVLEK